MKIASDAGLNFDNFYKPKADIVIDANTGAILYGDNIDTVRDSGSMAKLMSAYVVFRAIKEGKTYSACCADMQGSAGSAAAVEEIAKQLYPDCFQ